MTIEFKIAIISDTICPWCYIGYRRLQKAIQLFQKTYPGASQDHFEIEWKPYYLNPAAPTKGVNIQDRMVGRMGEERTGRAQQHMASLGRAEGVEIKYGGKTGNTRQSHQLLHLAKSKNLLMQNMVAEELFRLHFGEERNITDMETMLDAARNCGLPVDEARQCLESEAIGAEVDAEQEAVRALYSNGVPKFVFQDGRHVVDSAGDTMEFFELLMKIKEDGGSS